MNIKREILELKTKRVAKEVVNILIDADAITKITPGELGEILYRQLLAIISEITNC